MTENDPSAPLLQNVDLRTDPLAATYIKREIVQVQFAVDSGELTSREGPNRYAAGDAIITGATGDRWSVSRARFEARYQALAPTSMGQNGAYINQHIPVLARQMPAPFRMARSAGGDLLRGNPGDWLLQYAPGDYGVVEQGRFAQVYRKVAPP
ncbi:MAG: PGDYG domain-containing protein [Thiomonas sp.]|uniref:PGDYG domain-containing protein n=1 Tax=Thiomonas TaxID=32012 RepID=UPI00239BE601|nr:MULTISPECIES: PGDYG domain-containing protein [Thiomonas]MDE2269382.1 PGDYG domain-containing protein [Betaproteobacteria bacterium]HML80919.1 PGDYG domain-containing protein [Thiomonas arsenitoxydans]